MKSLYPYTLSFLRKLGRGQAVCLKSCSKNITISTVKYFSLTHRNCMKFAQFTYKDKPREIRVGFMEGENIIDINKADSSLPTTLLDILRNGDLEKVKRLKSKNPSQVSLSSVMLKAPIHGMDKILCIGLNYKDHCEQHNLKQPTVPMIFNKFPSTIVGPSDAVKIRTEVTMKVDWEVELTVVLGKKASNIKAETAYDYVFGYTVGQDISARDWQKDKNMGQFLLGKSMDTFCPIGPWIVTSDEIGDPQQLDIRCSLNSVPKQTSNTNQLIHKIPDVIERLATVMTLFPGDIILTGTPGGVGVYADPPEFLKPGDVLRSEVQNIGGFDIKIEKF